MSIRREKINQSKMALHSSGSVRYTSKIIKAGALLADTKTLLLHWDIDESVQNNLQRLQRENAFGKATRSRIEDIVAIFRQRYLTEEIVKRALVVLVNHRFSSAALDRILYFHSAKTDLLLYDVVTKILLPMQSRGITTIDVMELQRILSGWVKEGKMTTLWGEGTVRRVSQGILSTLRDFGVMQGVVQKRIAPAHLPVEAFAYLAFYLKQHQPSGAKLFDIPDWKLFFLSREGVERFLFEAHQNHLLEYHAAGSVIRLTFPASSLEEYAHVLAERAH